MSGTELGSQDLFPPPREEAAAPLGGPIHPESGLRTLLRRLAAPFVGAAMLALKLLSSLKLALLALTKVKLLGTAATMLISIGAYALLWGWPFAALFVLLIFVHELGHVVWLRREGVRATAPMFVPFLGAVIGMRGRPRDAYVEAKVGLAGPVLGTAGALAVLVWAEQVNSNLLRALAYIGFLLNLFNLIPIVPLDGGRAISALHPAFWFAGLFALAILFFKYESPILLLVLLFCCYELYRRWSRRNMPGFNEYHSVTVPQRIGIAAVYLGLVVLLVAGMHAAYVPRPS